MFLEFYILFITVFERVTKTICLSVILVLTYTIQNECHKISIIVALVLIIFS